jgi:2-polyprenyl-3-methyl-5-hydroxy-6-metoxy-1,4-benzoquinol methylase
MRWEIAQWFEKRWWKNYLKNKPVDDYLTWKRDYWNTFLNTINVTVKPNDSVLDAGCGPAGIFSALSENQVTAVDPLLSIYERDLQHFNRRNYPNVDFHENGIETLEFKEDFEIVFCLNVINHVEDLDEALTRLQKAVKPQGTFVLSIDSHNIRLPKWLFRTLPLDILHPHQYDLAEYQNMVLKRGFGLKNSVLIKDGFLFNYYALVFEKA